MAKLGSLFDGSGGFPLAGAMCGIEPAYASEVEPYPIAVTRSRFPDMVHLGSVTEVNGADIEPCDVITFGSPCQSLSVAGKQEGIKHSDLGDEETTRSGLFMEAVRIIKEMREKTNGQRPTFAVWENVPGAFSSNKGADFRCVLEELIKIVEPKAVMPEIPKGGWAYADCYVGDGWSIAYRVFDAQYIRTAQRRRRIYLVLDLRGERAGEILFERESLRRYFTPCEEAKEEAKEEASADVRGGSVADDREGKGFDGYNGVLTGDKIATLGVNCDRATGRCGVLTFHLTQDPITSENVCPCLSSGNPNHGQACIGVIEKRNCEGFDVYNQALTGDKTMTVTGAATDPHHIPCIVYSVENHPADSRVNVDDSGVNSTLVAKGPSAVCYVDTTHADDVVRLDNVTAPLQARDYKGGKLVQQEYIVRRLTPTECARLQGFPDRWGDIDKKDSFTDEEYAFWFNVRKTDAEINGKQVKDWTKKQMLTWYNKLHTDSAEYKMWGNGIALPCALYVMEGIAEALEKERVI